MLAFIFMMMLIIFSTIYNLTQIKYKQDLLAQPDTKRLAKRGIKKLELKRFRRNLYIGFRNSANQKKKEIPLDAPIVESTGFFNTIEDELCVIGYTQNSSHDVYKCPFSQENKDILSKIVQHFNNDNIVSTS